MPSTSQHVEKMTELTPLLVGHEGLKAVYRWFIIHAGRRSVVDLVCTRPAANTHYLHLIYERRTYSQRFLGFSATHQLVRIQYPRAPRLLSRMPTTRTIVVRRTTPRRCFVSVRSFRRQYRTMYVLVLASPTYRFVFPLKHICIPGNGTLMSATPAAHTSRL